MSGPEPYRWLPVQSSVKEMRGVGGLVAYECQCQQKRYGQALKSTVPRVCPWQHPAPLPMQGFQST